MKMNGYILERINDLTNYLAHIALFASQLPVGMDSVSEAYKVRAQIVQLRGQLVQS